MEYIKLGQISTIKNGKRNAQDAIKNGLYPLFDRSVNIKRSDKYMFDKEAIIVAGEGKTFLPKYYKGKFDLHQRCYAIFDFASGILPKYIYYYIQRNQAYFQSVYTGSTVPSLRLGNFENMPVKLYALNYQEQIIRNFENINFTLSVKQQELSLLDELTKSRFIEMFGNDEGEFSFEQVIRDETKEGYKFDSSNYSKTGEIAIVDQSKDLICGYKSEGDARPPYKKECIIFGDHTETFKYINFPIYLGADGTKILRVLEQFDTRFVFEFLNIHYLKVGGYSRHFKFLKEQKFIKPDFEKQKEFRLFCEQVDKSKFIVQQQIKDLQELLDKKMDECFGE